MTIRPAPLALPGRRIGVSYESSSNLFCRDLTDGVQEAAAARGIAVIARDCAQSPQRQLADTADLLDAAVDALVISPEDPAAIGPALAAAAARGVPVVTVDRAADGPVLSHITSDNRLGGRLAADLLSAELGGQGEVAIVGRPWPGRFDAPHVTSTEQDGCAPRGLAPGEVMGGEGAEQQDPRNHSAWGRTVLLIGGPSGCGGRNVYSPWIRRRATSAMRASRTPRCAPLRDDRRGW
jgi:Periplasmic binding protein domain